MNYKRAYNEQFYDRLAVTISKGHKALLARLGLEEWPHVEARASSTPAKQKAMGRNRAKI
ncbi:MAG: hypothetical protein FWD25_08855 [Clostridia bacterium]|nr:hypothetical protein [Clostridia bacterium]